MSGGTYCYSVQDVKFVAGTKFGGTIMGVVEKSAREVGLHGYFRDWATMP